MRWNVICYFQYFEICKRALKLALFTSNGPYNILILACNITSIRPIIHTSVYEFNVNVDGEIFELWKKSWKEVG